MAALDAEDPLQSLFAQATRGSEEPAVLSSVKEWTAFYSSLEHEGLVSDQREEQTLQKLWDREVLSATAFGRKGKPQLSLAKIHQVGYEMSLIGDCGALINLVYQLLKHA